VKLDGLALDFAPVISDFPALMNLLGRRVPLSGTDVTVKALETMIAANDSVFCQGYVVKDTVTGERWKIRTPTYKMLHELRGNTPRLDFFTRRTAMSLRRAVFLAGMLPSICASFSMICRTTILTVFAPLS
jgi:hypothetical protein